MPLIKPIDLSGIKNIREAIQAVISGRVERIEWTRSLNLKLDTDGKQGTLTVTDGSVEVDIPGPWSPDMVQVTANQDRTGTISLSMKDIPFRW